MSGKKYLLCVTPMFLFISLLGLCTQQAYAKQIQVLLSGETHAMLYPCSCPTQPDGGAARRAGLVRSLLKENPNSLVLDSGGFSSGGLLDEYTQNTQLDKQRALANLEAMEVTGYDAVAVGDDEFSFGKEFFFESIKNSKINFLSSNIVFSGVGQGMIKPYIIKEVDGVKFGIFALSPKAVVSKAEGVDFIEPEEVVNKTISKLKSAGADIIICLSHLGENSDLKLFKDIQDLDILVTGHSMIKEALPEKVGSAYAVRPFWQGKRLVKLTLDIEGGKISGFKSEEIRLSNDIKDDPQVLAFLPACFSDADCRQAGVTGKCRQPGDKQAECLFEENVKVNLSLILPKNCKICTTQSITDFLKAEFPGLAVRNIYYPGRKADKLISELGITALPAYILGKEVAGAVNFNKLKDNLELKGDQYLVKPEFSGVSFFLNRREEKGRFELFLSIYQEKTKELLDIVESFNPQIHLLAVETASGFEAARGNLEVEDYMRAACVKKYYPDKYWDYLKNRSENIQSSWWENALPGADTYKIKACAQSDEGKGLLRENIALNKELKVMFGPTFLLDNNKAFGFKEIPTKEQFEKLISK